MEPRTGHTQLSANRAGRAYERLPSKMVETQEDFHHRFLGTGRSLKIWEFSLNRKATVSLPYFSTYLLPTTEAPGSDRDPQPAHHLNGESPKGQAVGWDVPTRWQNCLSR